MRQLCTDEEQGPVGRVSSAHLDESPRSYAASQGSYSEDEGISSKGKWPSSTRSGGGYSKLFSAAPQHLALVFDTLVARDRCLELIRETLPLPVGRTNEVPLFILMMWAQIGLSAFVALNLALGELNGAPDECDDSLQLLQEPNLTQAKKRFPAKSLGGAYMSNKESKLFRWTPTNTKLWQIKQALRNLAAPIWVSDDDQLGHGGWVAYSRRQVCHITAKAFLGSKTPGYQSGLRRLMKMCKTTGDFRKAFASLLAACYADPTLANGGQGPILLAAKAKVAPSVEAVREKAKGEAVPLTSAGLRVCDYDTGAVAGAYEHLETVPTSGCQARPQDAVGVDFMTGGLAGQATQDISASWFGGYLFDAGACGLGGGQDERLSVYFPEVTVLAYFLSESHPFPQVRQPLWILGARNFFKTLDGTARFDSPMELADVPLDNDLVEVPLAGANVKISSSRPFVVFMSESQGFFDETMPNLHLARTNRLPAQRDMGQGKASFEKQVRAWYRSLALTSYDEDVQPALKALVSSVGAGPWLAGLWWGDSQLGFLAVWLGQALAATTWGTLPLDTFLSAGLQNPR
eukprot:g20180.t1